MLNHTLTRFSNDQPEEGAAQLRKWAWDVIEFRDGIPIPAVLNTETTEELLTHLDFLGERALFAIHFAVVAIARKELTEAEYREIKLHLDDSIKRFPILPRSRDWILFPIIAAGLQADKSTIAWLKDAETPSTETDWALVNALLPTQNVELLRDLAYWGVELGETDWVTRILRNVVRYDQSGLAADLLNKLPSSAVEESFLTDLIVWGLGENDPDTARSLIDQIKDRHYRARAEASIGKVETAKQPEEDPTPDPETETTDISKCCAWLQLITEAKQSNVEPQQVENWIGEVKKRLPTLKKAEDEPYGEFCEGPSSLEKEFLIACYHYYGSSDLTEYEVRMLKLYESAKQDPEIDYFESEEIIGALCEVWAATGHFDKLFAHLDKLDPKGCMRDVTESLFNHWNPERDVPRILEICRPVEDPDEEDDEAPCSYMMERFLHTMVMNLASKKQYNLARQIAQHTKSEFNEDDGFEYLATYYLWSGDYQSARELGGGTPDRYLRPDGIGKDFIPGTKDDSEALDYYRSIKNWQDSTKPLLHLSWHGAPREAVTNLIRLEIKQQVADWLHSDYYVDDPNYPRDYEKLRLHAKEEAQSEIRSRTGSEHHSPLEFRLLRIFLLIIIGLINLLVYRRWTNPKDDKTDRKDETKQKNCREAVSKALANARQEADREKRVRILEQATDHLHYVDRFFSDRYIEATDLATALRDEITELQKVEKGLRDYDARPEWERLARALRNAHDVESAGEAWQHHDAYAPIPPNLSRELVKSAGKNNWHFVAPFCATNPLSAAILAEKLELW